jgi:periplasmic mercuric ion binding protein
MKPIHNLRILLLLPALATLVWLPGCGAKGNASAEFWVRGNCEMCKATIEASLTANPGVAAADYQIETQTLHVDYDSTQVNLAGLHAACASAGYETKTQAAQEKAYAELPKCCKKPEDQ